MKCDTCGRKVDSRREEIEHVLEQHGDKITSHEKDELKRELNSLEKDSSSSSLPVRKLGIAAAVLAVIVGGGYALSSAGVLSFSTDSEAAGVGPAGSTHEHAQFSVFIDGDEIDFSQSRYQLQSQRIHFEGGDGEVIHKHATGVTIGFALETHDLGINATCLTMHDDVYCEGGGATLDVTVDEESIEEPASHVIQDGEVIDIRYSS